VCVQSACQIECVEDFGDCTTSPPKACTKLPRFFIDEDGDGHAGTKTKGACKLGPGLFDKTTDCHDGNEDVFPGQTAFFETAYTTTDNKRSFDYDCSKTETRAAPIVEYKGCDKSLECVQQPRQPEYIPATPSRGTGTDDYCGSTSARECRFTSGCGDIVKTLSAVKCH
jgi:hypothetical protein